MGNAAAGCYQDLKTSKRSRKILTGSFVTAGTSSVTTPIGDGVPARTGVGVFTVTLPKKWGIVDACMATITLAAAAASTIWSSVYDPTTGIVTIKSQTGGSAADTTGATIQWIAVLSDRSPI